MSRKSRVFPPDLRNHQRMDQLFGMLAARFGLRADEIRSHPSGAANQAYTLGPALFLRVPRSAEFERDLAKEAAVIPIARSAGVRTPEIVAQGSEPVPYMVLERVHGAEVTAAVADETIWSDLAEQLARLHQFPVGTLAGVHTDTGGDPFVLVDRLAVAGYFDRDLATWLRDWFDRLSQSFDPNGPVVLLHGDVAPQNLLSSRGGDRVTIIDWGDAVYGPPAMEFAKLPLEQAALVVNRHVDHVPGAHLTELAAGTLWYHLCWGLAGLARQPQPHERHWTAPPASRLLGLLRFAVTELLPPWPELLGVGRGFPGPGRPLSPPRIEKTGN